MKKKIFTSIGLMSGTSMDGVDLSVIKSDGNDQFSSIYDTYKEFDDGLYKQLISLRDKIRNFTDLKNHSKEINDVEKKFTLFNSHLINEVIGDINEDIDLIGFHGQTIHHDPDKNITIQMGDGDLLAKLCDIDVVNDFRSNDVLNGGQGAPLVPLFHQAIIGDLPKPFMILNVGGVANVSWVDEMDEVSAFDSGPGNALIDDFMYQRTGSRMDQNGNLALSGKVNSRVLKKLMENL